MSARTTAKNRRGPGRPSNPVARETLLAIARDAFAERGYSGASMSVIAERAGIRKSSLFHHFSTKDALYDEVFASVLDELGLLLGEAIAPGRPFVERLDRLGDALTRHLGAKPAVARLLLREFTSRGPVLDRPGRARIEGTLAATSAFLEGGMVEGVIPRQDPAHLAMSVVGLHLVHFAAPEVSGSLVGGDVFDPSHVEARRRAVQEQVRRLCGAEVGPVS